MLVWADKTGRVQRIHYQPHLLSAAKRTGGVKVAEEPPRPEVGRGEQPVAFLDGDKLKWEIEPRELTAEERIEVLQEYLDATLTIAESKKLLTRKEVEVEVEVTRSRKPVEDEPAKSR